MATATTVLSLALGTAAIFATIAFYFLCAGTILLGATLATAAITQVYNFLPNSPARQDDTTTAVAASLFVTSISGFIAGLLTMAARLSDEGDEDAGAIAMGLGCTLGVLLGQVVLVLARVGLTLVLRGCRRLLSGSKGNPKSEREKRRLPASSLAR